MSMFNDGVLNEPRFALRSLRKNPSFTAVALLMLALGIGANTAIFSVIETTMLRLPFPHPDRLVVVQDHFPNSDGPASLPDFLGWRQANRSFADGRAYTVERQWTTSSRIATKTPARLPLGRPRARPGYVPGPSNDRGRGRPRPTRPSSSALPAEVLPGRTRLSTLPRSR